MISTDDAKRIADGWIRENSQNSHVVLADQDRTFFFELDDLIYHHPTDALVVLERIADQPLTDWAFEIIACGPMRTFLHLHGNQFDDHIDGIDRRVAVFVSLRTLAIKDF